jgi:purine-binding chemotaxis protein CheW
MAMDKRDGSSGEILVFELEDRRYGLPLDDVIETVRAVAITPLPQAPPMVEGILNFRGKVVPVLDIRARFRQRAKAMEIHDHLILARTGKRQVALRVDRAAGLVRVPGKDLEEAEKIVPGLEYVSGVARLPDGLVLIHDLGTFLSGPEDQALSESLSAFEKART